MSPLIRLCLAINLFSSSHAFRMFMKCSTLLHALLKWILNFLFHCMCYYPYCKLLPVIGEDQLSVCHYVYQEDVDCAVCLCKMREGEEIRVLRCEHVFHRHCLDTWLGFNNAATCPLCRDSVGEISRELGGAQVTEHRFSGFGRFDFSSIKSDDDHEIRWLR